MSSTATLRGRVELDLRDTGNAVWSDAQLDRGIERAVREYSHFNPLQTKTTVPTNSNSRVINIASLTPRIRVVAVEYPTGEYPHAFVPFGQWGDDLEMDIVETPSGTPNTVVWWEKEHTQHATTDSSCTYPATDDELIVVGAAGYALLEFAGYISNRVNVGGEEAWGKYKALGDERVARFLAGCKRHPNFARVRPGRLYSTLAPRLTSQTTDPGPL